MRQKGEKGLTLVELLISLGIMGIIAASAVPLLSSSLEIHEQGTTRSRLYHEGLMAMEKMTSAVKSSTYLSVPNAHSMTRNFLVFSGSYNDDDDYYFDDPLFPRIDEDLWRDMNNDGAQGLATLDDDDDGWVDEGFGDYDDDEDGLINEEILDGLDNDGDGNIDEDFWADLNMDWAPGVIGMDDDGDGSVDEGDVNDDDEDGQIDEDPLSETLYFWYDWSTILYQAYHPTFTIEELSNHVTNFEVTFISPGLIQINLELTGDDGEVVQFSEYVYARNTYQRTGKRVR